MGASARAADSALEDSSSSKKSIFSLLSLPLRSRARNRNLAEFYVQVDEPHRQYYAGDHVTGSVILSVIKPVRLTHLTVCLHGYVQVFKSAAQVRPLNPAVDLSDRGSKNFKYLGNGHAQLFQDEQVLCGEGRLDARRWQFKFDLIFPEKGLPSSIDFERGTISYLVTATLTRPTSISPTTSAETKVALVERVDVGLVSPPRERRVTMHAMHKRQRRKKTAAASTTPSRSRSNLTIPESSEAASDFDSVRANENSNNSSADSSTQSGNDSFHLPRSPIQSDIQSELSAESTASHNSNSGRGGVDAGAASKAPGSIAEDREITATVELLKGGYLPGELLPVKIKVEHNRRMKSLHGIIVTFYRQGRVDYAPPASLFSNLSAEEARKLEREEYYPKSRTGLGGLSLSSAGSCSVFRKDLSQAVAPLIIDPVTLSAHINTSVRVPEDVFPTIKNIPGGLIGFKYHVEVIVDLGGRLAGQSQGTPQPPARGRVGSVPGTSGEGSATASAFDAQFRGAGNWNNTMFDTDHIRREKGVITVSFEVVVGNVNSNRSRGKAIARSLPTLETHPELDHVAEGDDEIYSGLERGDHGDYEESKTPWGPHDSPGDYYPQSPTDQAPRYQFDTQESVAPAYVPPPQIPNQNGLSDKERARQAEERLLPSQPSQPASVYTEAGPSWATPRNGPSSQLGLPPWDPDESTAPPAGQNASAEDGPSAPTLADLSQMAHTHPTDDKQELERRRLLAEASAPPQMPEDIEPDGPSAPPVGSSIIHEASAPVLDEHNMYMSHQPYESAAGPSGSSVSHNHDDGRIDELPRYER
ncbi:hypothetical protein BX600DRAFT_431910 [Xylariales sp. PMI_506]|nr:hypothetical protein BX600DRAFT_431910 [Xylariales sp. PMI_506]